MASTTVTGNRSIPIFDDDLITNIISMNFSGRFKGQEVKDLGQAIIRHMVTAKKVDLFFGQQANFRLSSLPDNYDVIGSQRTFLLFNKKTFQSNDEAQYRHFLRDLELRGRLQKYYLPDANYTLCKIKSKVMDDTSFIAMSWFTDENKDKLRSENLLRKLLSFTANLCGIEEMPVIIAGSFRLSLDDVKQIVYNEFEGFRCYGYKTEQNRRASRMSSIYISCPPLKLEEVKPVVSGKIEIYGNKIADRWRHLEDAFYWDPVYARMLRRNGTSSVTSPESPRAISPSAFDAEDVFGGEESGSTLQLGDCPYVDPQHSRPTFPSAEDTLKVLLAESERIKELVSEAETKARKRLEARATLYGKTEHRPLTTAAAAAAAHYKPSQGTQLYEAIAIKVEEDSKQTATGRSDDGAFPPNFDLEAEARKVAESLQSGMKFSFDEDEEFQLLERAFEDNHMTGEDDRREPDRRDEVDRWRTGGSASQETLDLMNKSTISTIQTLGVPPSSPLRKIPSYVDLYDEELIETSKVCYMQ